MNAQEPEQLAETTAQRAEQSPKGIDAKAPPAESPIEADDYSHWSYAQLQPPSVPSIFGAAFNNPIDCFIADRLRSVGLEMPPNARPDVLLRRLALDLTGLPPSADDWQRWREQSQLPDAYERQVDRWLASPACGEHLAQSWLDLARFAETDGFEHDKVRDQAWRYRDWVIAALNQDMPYDEFMRQQVAGDLLTDNAEAAIATAFCLSGPDMPDLNDQAERRHNLLNELTGTFGAVFLGLQLGCAACHDHKYDPISQADFYRLRGLLATGVPDLVRDQPVTRLQVQPKIKPVHFFHRGDHRMATAELTASVPRLLASGYQAEAFQQSQQPRLLLADWMSDRRNPLPARTQANRIWLAHFGRGLAATPGDLGLVGIAPTHPELLDWLSVELQKKQWSQQSLRRMIVLSATYRAAASQDALETGGLAQPGSLDFQLRLKQDPSNRFYSRYPLRRLSGEMLRDGMLQVANELNRTAGGPGVMPPLPIELMQTLLPGQWKVSERPEDHVRRSIYLFARRNLRYPIFESFDRPDAGASCPLRSTSVTATQSLLMFNSEFSWSIAQRLGQQSLQQPAESRAEYLWQRILGREPTEVELSQLHTLHLRFGDELKGWQAAALALVNCNEFVTY